MGTQTQDEVTPEDLAVEGYACTLPALSLRSKRMCRRLLTQASAAAASGPAEASFAEQNIQTMPSQEDIRALGASPASGNDAVQGAMLRPSAANKNWVSELPCNAPCFNQALERGSREQHRWTGRHLKLACCIGKLL